VAVKVLLVIGTRPEAIKLCPLAQRLSGNSTFEPIVCVTGQHRDLLDSVLRTFGVVPKYDLDAGSSRPTLAAMASRVLSRLDPILAEEAPELVYVQGDTTSAMIGAMAAFYRRIPVAHVEAGLRTGDLASPFPEEAHRVVAARLCALHFAPTEAAAANLRREGVKPQAISVTGNTGIDALLWMRDRLASGTVRGYVGKLPGPGRRLVLLTAHRRESFGDGLSSICAAVRRIVKQTRCEVVWPVHPNPNVQSSVHALLAGVKGVHLIGPLDYAPFVDLVRRADLILSDSGGIQEEAPSLGVPVLVLRDKTERMEAIDAGTAMLVGRNADTIVRETCRLLESDEMRRTMTAGHNPFGDGRACERIATATISYLRKYSFGKTPAEASPKASRRLSTLAAGL
jgi:UDP-N-acetylglucosamine 2-epimerase (non-hydrolysing)